MKIIKRKTHDYTLEITRCMKFMGNQYLRGIEMKDVITQAVELYGYSIAWNARKALIRSFERNEWYSLSEKVTQNNQVGKVNKMVGTL